MEVATNVSRKKLLIYKLGKKLGAILVLMKLRKLNKNKLDLQQKPPKQQPKKQHAKPCWTN
jgi:hypothetical protein